MKAPSQPVSKAKTTRQTVTLDQQLERKLAALREYRGAVRFLRTHRSLLSAAGRPENATSALVRAELRVRKLSKTVAVLRAKVRRRDARLLAALPPRKAICAVFEERCEEAIAVAWCESHLQTTAHNGQYLGLFQ